MIAARFIASLLLLAQSTMAQVYCVRAVGSTPTYERVFVPKGDLLRPPTLRGVDDLAPSERYGDTNRIDRLFVDASLERTNGFAASCISEVPMGALSLGGQGGLLTSGEICELLRGTVVVPRSRWTNHVAHGGGGRYVFSLLSSNRETFVIDLRAGASAIIFFPDGTYRCVTDPGYSCLSQPRPQGSANVIRRIPSSTNQPASVPASRR